MPDKIQSKRILCQGGLNTAANFLALSESSPGSAVQLVNFETALSGGYRRINGYTKIDAVFFEVTSVANPAEGPVLGVWGFLNSTTGTFQIMAARKLVGSAVYGIYLFDASTGWSKINTGTTQTATGVDHVRAEAFGTQTDNWIIFVDGVNKALAFNSTTWYQLSSGGAGGAGSPGGNQIIDAPAVITYFKETVFLSADVNSPAIVAYSAPNDPLTWTAAAGAGQQIAGFDVVQIKSFRDELFIFGKSKIKKSIPDLASGFVLQDVTNNIGCVARDSVLEVGGDLLFLSADGIRPIAGTTKIGDIEFGLLSENIHNTIKDIIDTYDLDHLHSVVIRTKTQFRYFLSDASSTDAEGSGLIGSIQNDMNASGKWEYGEISGIQANAVWSGYNDEGEELIIHGNNLGYVFYQENGNTFNGTSITAIYKTPYLDFGDTTIRKLFRRLNVFLSTEGSVVLNLGITYDWNRTDVINPAGYTATGAAGAASWDSGVEWDDGTDWGEGAQPIFNINIQGSAFAVQASLVTIGFAPYTIQGLVYEFSVKGGQ